MPAGLTKIAFVTPYLSTGGAERAFLNIAVFLFGKGVNVQIVAASILPENKSKLPPALPVFDLKNNEPLDSPAFYRNTKSLLRYANKENPDVIISTSDYLNIALVFARRFAKKKFKIIVSQQLHASSYLKELPPANRKLIKLIQHVIARNADMIIGASKGVAEDFSNLYNIPFSSGKICSIYNPIYEDKIPQMASEPIRDEVFAKHGIKLITVGRLVRQKDHVTLLKAFNLLLTERADSHLFIMGTGPEESNLKSILNDLGITRKVTFLGYKENPYAYVARCDLFILSSEYEGFGNVVVEALAAGVNVVSTDCPSGPAEILNNGEFGFMCPVKDPCLMKDAIIKALNNKMPAAKLQSRAKEFSIENSSDQYLAAALSLLKNNG